MSEHIPEDATWYLAWLVQDITVEDDPRNVVHTSTRLIRADSPEEAYDKAMLLGSEEEATYENTQGKRVTITFRGLTDLNVIYEELEDGAELAFDEEVGVPEEEIGLMITEKENLTVFRNGGPPEGPDYVDREIAEELEHDFGRDDDR